MEWHRLRWYSLFACCTVEVLCSCALTYFLATSTQCKINVLQAGRQAAYRESPEGQNSTCQDWSPISHIRFTPPLGWLEALLLKSDLLHSLDQKGILSKGENGLCSSPCIHKQALSPVTLASYRMRLACVGSRTSFVVTCLSTHKALWPCPFVQGLANFCLRG